MLSGPALITRAIALATMAAATAAPQPATEPELADTDLPRLPALSPNLALASFTTAPGYRIELAASEPEVVDPVALSFDETGALFVVEMRDYSERRAESLSRIRRLTDADGDGRYESSTVFLDGLAWATGVVCARGGIYVAASPDIVFARDTDGDGVADEKRAILSGFGTGRASLNVQALVNSLTFGPDNRVWGATAGNGGTVSGVRLDGADFSFDPATDSLAAESGTAQYGLTFDASGRRFVCSNSRHILWVGLERPYTDSPLTRSFQPLVDIPIDGAAAEVFRLSPEEPWRVVRTHWRASGVVPGIVEGGGRASGYFTSASGLAVYTGDLMPDLAGQVFVGDVGSNLVHRKILDESPDGPIAHRHPAEARSEFLASRDTWFRPVACANGPDGGLYIIDMYREIIEHPDSLPPGIKRRLDLNSGNDRGRIYRIVPENARRRRAVDLRNATTPVLAVLTTHPNGWHRSTARRLLIERRDPVAPPILRALPGFDALATLAGLDAVQPDDLRRALTAQDPATVQLGLRLLEQQPDASPALASTLAALGSHPSPAVRRQWPLTLGRVPLKGKSSHLAQLWTTTSEAPHLRNAIRLALRTGSETLDLLRLLPEPDSELVAMIGRSQESAVIAETAAWIRAHQGGNPARLLSLTLALDDARAITHLADAARQMLADPAASAEVRAAAAALLAREGTGDSTSALQHAFLDPSSPEPVRAAAWLAVGPALAPDVWKTWPGLPSGLRGRVIERAIAQPTWHQPLLAAVANGTISPLEISTAQANQLRTATDAATAAAAIATLGPPPPDRQAAIASLLPALKLSGHPSAGETVFRQRCLTCHRLGTEGADVGPDRTTFRNLGKPTLLASIVDPNREVAPRYLAATLVTTSGDTWQGIILRDDPAGVTLKPVGGTTLEIPRTKIATLDRLARSLMPEGLEVGLSHQDLADLLEFLSQ